MKSRLFVLSLVAILTITLLGTSLLVLAPSNADVIKSVDSLAMFQGTKFNAHYRAPNIEQVETLLERAGISLTNPESRTQAVQRFMQKWAERNPTTPNPQKLQELLEREREGEEKLVHEITGEILSGVANMDPLLEMYEPGKARTTPVLKIPSGRIVDADLRISVPEMRTRIRGMAEDN